MGHARHKGRPLVLAASVFFLMMSFVVRSPAITEFVQHRVCMKHFPNALEDSDNCNSASITGEASKEIMYLTVAQVVPAVVTATAMGAFSDRDGRKLSLVLAASSSLLESTLTAMIVYFDLDLKVLLFGEVAVGCLGGMALFLMAVFSMVIDSIKHGERTLYIGMFEGVIYLAMVIGFLGGGYLIRYQGYFAAFVSIQCLSALAVLATVFSKETLVPSKRRRVVTWREANIVGVLSLVARKRGAAILAAIFSVQVACKLGLLSVTILYVRHMWPAAWPADRVNIFLASDAITKSAALYISLPLLQRCTRPSSFLRRDSVLISLGLAALLVSYLTPLALGDTLGSLSVWLMIVPGPISGVVAPVIRSCLSKYVGLTEQGKMMSLVAAVETISGLLAPLIFNEVYPATVQLYPAAIYGVAAGITVVCLVAMAFVPPPDAHPDYALASVSEAGDAADDVGDDNDEDRDNEETLALLGSIQVAAPPLKRGALKTPVPALRQ